MFGVGLRGGGTQVSAIVAGSVCGLSLGMARWKKFFIEIPICFDWINSGRGHYFAE
jgi:hypothetical protein